MNTNKNGDTLDKVVYKKLREMIITKQFNPGEIIIQNQLAESLQVSRTPLRRAMAQLETEGLLTRTSKGWLVEEFTKESMASIFEIRGVLEGLACRLAIENISFADICYIKGMFEEAYNIFLETSNVDPYYKADIKFHSMIIDLTNDKNLIRTINACQIIDTSLMEGLYRSPNITYKEHRDIIDAIYIKDGKLAENLMREHSRKTVAVIRNS